jgi:tRNA-Thr(GGU) m(6)t(6)A37 methyltransferase TsaA
MFSDMLRRFVRAPAGHTTHSTALSSFTVRPIGLVHNDRTELGPDGWLALPSRIVLFDEFRAGLDAISGFSHIIVLTWLDRVPDAERRAIALRPEGDRYPGAVGIFALRVPARPNPIGVTVVPLLAREGTVLHVRGLDAVDGTPVLDVKPYLPRYDSVPEASLPDWATPD